MEQQGDQQGDQTGNQQGNQQGYQTGSQPGFQMGYQPGFPQEVQTRNQPGFQPGFQPNNMYQGSISPKKIVSVSFFALFVLAIVVNAVQVAISVAVNIIKPEIAETDWYTWAITAVSLVVIGLPVFYLIIRAVPDSPKGRIQKMTPVGFIGFFFVCASAMYITNFFSMIITFFISAIKGSSLINPASEAILNGNFVISLIYASIIAPITEELIFRKLLLDKLRRFGDIPAILMTGLAFGLFHFNLMQFFYAAVLGFLFAYITIRTNTVIYSIILHMMVNFISTAITPFVKEQNIIFGLLITFWVFLAIALGAVIFILNIKKIRLYKTQPLMRITDYILNPGVIAFLAISFVLIAAITIFS
jgi:membrane protease YdiL (CAAX protease family)